MGDHPTLHQTQTHTIISSHPNPFHPMGRPLLLPLHITLHASSTLELDHAYIIITLHTYMHTRLLSTMVHAYYHYINIHTYIYICTHICILIYSRPCILSFHYIHMYICILIYSRPCIYYHNITYVHTFAYYHYLCCVVLCCVISRVTLHGFFYMPPSLLVARISYQSLGLRPSHETFLTPLFTHASSWISLAAFSRRELYRVEWWAMCVCQVKPLKCKVFYQ